MAQVADDKYFVDSWTHHVSIQIKYLHSCPQTPYFTKELITDKLW